MNTGTLIYITRIQFSFVHHPAQPFSLAAFFWVLNSIYFSHAYEYRYAYINTLHVFSFLLRATLLNPFSSAAFFWVWYSTYFSHTHVYRNTYIHNSYPTVSCAPRCSTYNQLPYSTYSSHAYIYSNTYIHNTYPTVSCVPCCSTLLWSAAVFNLF